jgi:hypothetical protein
MLEWGREERGDSYCNINYTFLVAVWDRGLGQIYIEVFVEQHG